GMSLPGRRPGLSMAGTGFAQDGPAPGRGTRFPSDAHAGTVTPMLHVTLLSDDGGVVRLQAEGQISQADFQGEGDPIENALGPDVFARPVLLDLGRTDYIDSTGIGWLIFSPS